MDSTRSRTRDQGLARTRVWTRRIALAATLGCATLAAAFAHVLPGHLTAQTGTTGGSAPTSSGQHHPGTAPVQPPGPGAGSGQVTSGGS
jgi:hypothetical protein